MAPEIDNGAGSANGDKQVQEMEPILHHNGGTNNAEQNQPTKQEPNMTTKEGDERDCCLKTKCEDGFVVGIPEETSGFGCCGIKPKCLKPCGGIKWFLFFVSLNGLLHFLVPFGLTFSVLTTLEKRFHFSSTESGYVVSSYEFAGMFFTLLISYVGEKGNKPVWIGAGSLLLAVASVIFALPHFVADFYDMTPGNHSDVADAVCPLFVDAGNESAEELSKCGDFTETEDAGDVTSLYWMFVLAQVMFGIGGAPITTLAVAYLDESLRPRDFGLYMGIYNAFMNVGPPMGFFLGALTLSLYTDVTMETDSMALSPKHPLWVGAWWLGFVICACLALVLGLVMMGFPKLQPGSEEIVEEQKLQAQKGSEYEMRAGFCEKLVDFPKALCNLLTNLPFLSLTLGQASEWFFMTGLVVFMPKFFEAQFGMSSSEVAIVIGVLMILAQLFGAIGSGVLINRLDLKFRGLMNVTFVCIVLSIPASFAFLMHCPLAPFAGVTYQSDTSAELSPYADPFSAPCNTHCDCQALTFDPVCGSDGIMYYSACHAGCMEQSFDEDGLIYSQCKCLLTNSSLQSYTYGDDHIPKVGYAPPPHSAQLSDDDDLFQEGVAVPGGCSTSCVFKWPLLLLIWLLFFLHAVGQVPIWASTIRCVSHSQRSFALGVQTLILNSGTATAPIAFGVFIDRACLFWEMQCDGARICWFYDNQAFAYTMLGLCVTPRLMSVVFFGGAKLFYKPLSGPEDIDTSD